MKKRLGSLLLSMAMCLSLLPVSALAGETDVINVSNQSALESAVSNDDHSVRLMADITLTEALNIIETVTLDLNGHVLKLEDDGNGNVIYITAYAKLTLKDSDNTAQHQFAVDSTTGLWTLCDDADCDHTDAQHRTVNGGVITGGSDIGVNVENGALELQGGTIVGNTGGGVSVEGSSLEGYSFTMSGGAIIGNYVGDSSYGGGVFLSDATFSMTGGMIRDNTAKNRAGGVYLSSGTSFTMSAGTIRDNTAGNGGGVYMIGGESPASFTMTGGTISNNTAGNGGGVYVHNSSTTNREAVSFEMSGSASITGNEATGTDDAGGGVYVNNGTFTMKNGTISNNTAKTDGGGVSVTSGGAFTMSGGTISDNEAGASNQGGGVFLSKDSTLTMTGGTISGNTAGYGGGVYVRRSTLTMSGGTISNNTAVWGGGVYEGSDTNTSPSTFTMSGTAKITGNQAIDTTGEDEDEDGSCGGGVYMGKGAFTMNGGTISNNTADAGGGVGGGASSACAPFTMTGGTISGNTATAYQGGGVFVGKLTFTMTGGSITGNHVGTGENAKGGGVYLDSSEGLGAFEVSGGATVRDNTKGGTWDAASGTYQNAASNNVYVCSGKTVTVADHLTGGAKSIGITTQDQPDEDTDITFAKGKETAAEAEGEDETVVAMNSTDKKAFFLDQGTDEAYIAFPAENQYESLVVREGREPHTHSWVVSGAEHEEGGFAMITVTCNSDEGTCSLNDGIGATFTIQALTGDDAKYDGEEKKITTQSNIYPWEATEAGTKITTSPIPFYTQNGESVDQVISVGTYQATIRYTIGESSDEASVTFTIDQAAYSDLDEENIILENHNNVTTDPYTATYTGEAIRPDVTSIKLPVGNGGDLQDLSDFYSVLYNDPDAAARAEYAVEYSNNVNAGTATVTIKPTEGGNFYLNGQTTFEIERAVQTITATDGSVAVGSSVDISSWAHAEGVKAGDTTGRISYELVDTPTGITLDGNTLTASAEAVANSSFQIKVTAERASNYEEATDYLTVTVTALPPASVTEDPDAISDLTYNGQQQVLATAGAADGGTVYYSLDNQVNWSTDIPKASQAGSYLIYYKAVGDAQHSDSSVGSFSVSIYPKTLTADDLEYTGAAISKEYDGNDGCGVEWVSVKASSLCGRETLGDIHGTMVFNSPNVYEAVKVTFTPSGDLSTNINGDSNYVLADNVTLDIPARITSKTVTPAASITDVLTYNGTEQQPNVIVMVNGNGLIQGEDYTVTYQNNINAGTDTAKAIVTAKANRNYTWAEPVTVSFSIGKANPVAPTGLLGKLNAALSTVALPEGWTWDDGTQVMSAMGEQTYAANYAGSDNYNAASGVNVAVNVTDKDLKALTVTMAGWTYGGTASEPNYTKPSDAANLKVEYKAAADTVYSTDVPTNAGEYTVRVSYETATEIWSGTADFTIAKARLTAPTFGTVTTGETWLSEVSWSTNAFADLTWDGEDVLVERGKSYAWTLTADPNNYDPASISGSVVLWPAPSSTPSGGGGGSSGSSGATITVPVASDHATVEVKAEVSKGNATVEVSDKQIEQVANDGAGNVTLDVSGLKNVDSATVPSHVVEKTNEAENTGLTVALPAGSVTLDETALESVTENADGKDVTVSVVSVPTTILPPAVKEIIGMEPTVAAVVDVNITVGGAKQSSFSGGKVTISIPYTPKKGEDTSKLTVWFIKDDGTIENKGGWYDATKKCFVFETEHLSQYLLVSAPVTFTDVPVGAYFYDAVAWAVDNGITGGTTSTTFSPYASCTRAQIVTFLYRWAVANGVDVSVGEDTNILSYNDAFSIPEYAVPAFQWAIGAGILQGNNGDLMPDQTCTRAQAATFLFRYAAANGMEAVTLQELVGGYGDAAQVPSYALPAFNWVLAQGIVNGNNGNLMPNNDCTRAQIVTMLYRLLGE